MADFSPHHSLLLKMPAALANSHSPNLPGLLFYSQQSHGSQAPPPASANAASASGGAATMAEDGASLESSSAVVDITSPLGTASSPIMDRKRKATEDYSATLSSGHSKVASHT